MVSPSDLCPSSLVSWKTLAAQRAGIRIRRPLPSTFVWRSFVERFVTTPEVVAAAVAGEEVVGSSGGVDLGTIEREGSTRWREPPLAAAASSERSI